MFSYFWLLCDYTVGVSPRFIYIEILYQSILPGILGLTIFIRRRLCPDNGPLNTIDNEIMARRCFVDYLKHQTFIT